MLMGEHPYREELMNMIGLRRRDFGRFRDVYSSDDGTEIIVFARLGGFNRDEWKDVISTMKARPDYVRDWDDEFDHTFLSIAFKTKPEHVERAKSIADQVDNRPPMVRYLALLDDVKSGKESAQVERAKRVGEKICQGVKKALEKGGSSSITNETGGIELLSIGGTGETKLDPDK